MLQLTYCTSLFVFCNTSTLSVQYPLWVYYSMLNIFMVVSRHSLHFRELSEIVHSEFRHNMINQNHNLAYRQDYGCKLPCVEWHLPSSLTTFLWIWYLKFYLLQLHSTNMLPLESNPASDYVSFVFKHCVTVGVGLVWAVIDPWLHIVTNNDKHLCLYLPSLPLLCQLILFFPSITGWMIEMEKIPV